MSLLGRRRWSNVLVSAELTDSSDSLKSRSFVSISFSGVWSVTTPVNRVSRCLGMSEGQALHKRLWTGPSVSREHRHVVSWIADEEEFPCTRTCRSEAYSDFHSLDGPYPLAEVWPSIRTLVGPVSVRHWRA